MAASIDIDDEERAALHAGMIASETETSESDVDEILYNRVSQSTTAIFQEWMEYVVIVNRATPFTRGFPDPTGLIRDVTESVTDAHGLGGRC